VNPHKSITSLAIASFLPLVRPDALLYSLSVFAVDFLRVRKVAWGYLLITGASVLVYFAFVKYVYGHWLPTPMVYKSLQPSMIGVIDWYDQYLKFKLQFKWYLLSPFHVMGILLVVASLGHFKNPTIRTLLYYFGFVMGVHVFYVISSLNIYDVRRYSIGFELILVVLPLVYLATQKLVIGVSFQEAAGPLAALKLELPDWIETHRASILGVAAALATVYMVVGYAAWRPDWNYGRSFNQNYRVSEFGVGGQIVDEIIPRDWTISLTEMNTFGYMNDREVIDLWGFTNPAIAYSSLCSEGKNRINPDFFLAKRPDIFWNETTWARGPLWIPDRIEFEQAEYMLSHDGPYSKKRYYLGDVTKVLKVYDVVFLNTQDWVTQLLVRKDRAEELFDILYKKNYERARYREIDVSLFRRLYDSQNLRQYRC